MSRQSHSTGTMRLFTLVLFMVLVLHALGGDISWAVQAPLKIGVLAIRGRQRCLDSWSLTAQYLTQQIAERQFVIVPLSHDQVYPRVEKGQVDFILANSSFYVGLEKWYRASRIATLKERRVSGVYTQYGGVIFCRADRKDLRSLHDLKDKTVMAVSESSLGGWLMARRELEENGIDPYDDLKALRFGETHDRVVYAVRDGEVDGGTVRTNTLEDLSIEGKIDLKDFHVFPNLHDEELFTPYFNSTRQYPGWPMAKVAHTSTELAERVAVVLLKMPPDSPAAKAAGSAGWTIPLNYQPVHDCLRVLKVGPYADLGKITAKDLFQRYGYWIFIACAAFSILVAFSALILELNRKIKASHERLETEIDLHQQTDEELKKAKELAETATRAKSEFLANMSHEIRTPMNGVIAATDLALSEAVPPKIAHYLQIIHSSAYSLLGIINDILDFSKIEAGKFELKERIFRLNEVFDRVMDVFVNKAAEKNIELLVDVAMNTPQTLMGDPLRLQQILTNLISNAIKFTESGGMILVSVKKPAEPVDDLETDQVILAFSVKDTGLGIAPEYIDLLFDPFSQADASSTKKYEGTGLGLSICKQLVTAMAGDIGVESELGIGSTFFFTVRLRQPLSAPITKLKVPPDIQGLNVLVVGTLADSRAVIRNILKSLGFRVESLSSGKQALSRLRDNALRNNPIELIMMDWKMPEMDGIAVSKKIRQELRLSMPIIMMTAFGKEEQRIEAEKVGANGFLTKPIYPSTLFDAIMDAFGKEGIKGAGRKKTFTTRASIYKKPLKGSKILVAEDNPTNQQVAEAILANAGIIVTLVNNGEAAVQAVRNEPFDAVLMDIQMPKMNGYEATRRIRELPQGASIPIVAMTAHAMKGDDEKCLEAGMDDYISKPVNQDRLFHALWRLLHARKRPSELITAEPDHDRDEMVADEGLEASGRQVPERQIKDRAALPANLPGIDIGQTLAALNIDDSAFRRILNGFLTDNRDTVQKIVQAFERHDRERIVELAHSLKGSAANIGAGDLNMTAQALETACRESSALDDDPSRLATLIDQMGSTLKQVMNSIDSLAASAPNETAEPATAATDLALDALLAKLAVAVDRADPQEISTYLPAVKRQAAACQTIDPFSIDTLEAQINRYDYDQAMQTIRKIRENGQKDP